MVKIFKPLTLVFAMAFIISAFGISQVSAGHHGGGKNKMEMMDADGDGSVSKDEFMNHKAERFSKKDANGDGVLTEDEMKKHCKIKDGEKKAEE